LIPATFLSAELRVLGTAPRQEVDVLRRVRPEPAEHGGRHVGLGEVGVGPRQDAAKIERHISRADDHNAFSIEDTICRRVRVAVVPGHELSRGDAAVQVLARDTESAVQGGARGVDDRVIAGGEVSAVDIGADREVAQEAHGRFPQDRGQR
jgi:hypothetical protein